MSRREPLPCDGFVAAVWWAGSIYSTICYDVVVAVTSVEDAAWKLAKIRASIALRKPSWRVGTDRLVADPAGRAVYLYVDVTFEDS